MLQSWKHPFSYWGISCHYNHSFDHLGYNRVAPYDIDLFHLEQNSIWFQHFFEQTTFSVKISCSLHVEMYWLYFEHISSSLFWLLIFKMCCIYKLYLQYVHNYWFVDALHGETAPQAKNWTCLCLKSMQDSVFRLNITQIISYDGQLHVNSAKTIKKMIIFFQNRNANPPTSQKLGLFFFTNPPPPRSNWGCNPPPNLESPPNLGWDRKPCIYL